ncbi:MAG TPA: cyclic nucleotide-binding domain-containing protein [Kofleriaceae bacterium]
MTKLKELEKRLRDEPDNLGLRVALAGAFVEAHRRDDAVELYRSVAIAYREQGRLHQAIAVCRSVLELAPGDASCHALLAAMETPVPRARTEPPPPVAKPPPEPPPLLPPEPDEDENGDDDDDSDDDGSDVQRLSLADLLPARPSLSDITPLPTPVPYEVAEPTLPPKLGYRDLPPSMREQLPDELAHVAVLEGLAAAAHRISASLLAGVPADDDLIEATEAGGDITIANDLDDREDDALVRPDLDAVPPPAPADPHAALDRLGTLRPTIPLSPAARRAAGISETGPLLPKRPSVSRILAVDDEKTQPREVPRQLRPATVPGGPATDPLDSALLRAVPAGHRAAVLARFHPRIAGVGTTVIRRGESGHGLVLVVRGRLDVHSERADGARVSLEAIGAGDYIGEISLLARAPAPAYVVAAVDCELQVLAADELYELIAAFPALRAEVRTTAERRIHQHDQLLRM